MSQAPLDVWARLLLAPAARIPVRYWPRLVLNLGLSAMITALTLPERLVLAPVMWTIGRARGYRLARERGGVIVLGYFRSGTTHLHNLLTCDPQFVTPRWYEALVPQAFVITWNFLRVFLVAFLSTKRPQDDMAFGPEWPAEDDFALNNWTVASSLPGRVVLPQCHEHYKRYHDLRELTPRELARWRRHQWAFLWKLTIFAGKRGLLLKTPCHTARVKEMMKLFGGGGASGAAGGGVKFVHISRTPAPVVRSNVAMLERMAMYNLQDSPPQDELRRRIVEEYDRTERIFIEESREVPAGDLVLVRYEDLIADPMGELRRIYAELGMEWTAEFERRVTVYLDSVREYRAASEKTKGGTKAESSERGNETPAELAWLVGQFGHDRPARPKVEVPAVGLNKEEIERQRRRAYWVALVASVIAGACWLGYGVAIDNRSDWVVWLVGIATGYATMRAASVGSIRLGFWAFLCTLVVFIGVEFAATRLIYYKHNAGPTAWEMWDATQKEIRSGATMPWAIFGMLTAYRFASRRHGGLPGKR